MFTTEAEWQRYVVAHARVHGWRVGINSPAHSDPGHPDLVLIHPRGDVIFAELKTNDSSLHGGQRSTLDALTSAGVDAYVWRPKDFAGVMVRLGGTTVPSGTFPAPKGPARPNPRAVVAVMLQAALDAVADAHGLTTTQVLDANRDPRLVAARHDYMAAARELTAASLPAIAEVIHRDHTTVVHGLKAHRIRQQEDPEFSTAYAQVREAARLAIAGVP